MANIPLNPQNVRFGEIAQRANPQASDPLQNQNTAGFPAAKPAVQPGAAAKPGLLPGISAGRGPSVRFTDGAVAPALRPSLQPVLQPAPTAPPALAPAAAPPAPVAPAIDPNTGLPVEQPFEAAPPAAPPAPALEDIPAKTLEQLVGPDNEWLGSGPDPRTAAEKEAAANSAAQAGQPQGGKSGQTSQARDAASAAGFTVPEGSGGGKGGGAGDDFTESDKAMVQQDDGEGGGGGSGGEDPEGQEPVPEDEPIVDPQDKGSDVPGQGGNTTADPNAGDFEFDDTGTKPEDEAPEFDRSDPETYPEGPRITGHTAAARARIQEYTDEKFKKYLKSGGSPENFEVYNPPVGKFNDIPKGPERHAARMRDRDRFYRQQQRAK